MGLSVAATLALQLGPQGLWDALTPAERRALYRCWPAVARPEQLLPEGAWTTWMTLSGRGWGKTRTGAETVIRWAREMPGSRGFLAARTVGDVRKVILHGESGIFACSPSDFRPDYEPSKQLVTWPNKTTALTFSSDSPDSGAGPQSHWGWADELAKWITHSLWDELQMGLRLGEHPRAIVTTTPKPVKTIRDLVADPNCFVTRGTTYDNAANLPRVYLEQILRKYQTTRLGRQELLAELLDDVPGALWTRALLELLHVPAPPELQRIVIGVDPATTSGEKSDLTGIIVAGLGVDGHAYVLEDLSCRLSSLAWAKRVVDAYERWGANLVVAEKNQGGDMVEATIRTVGPHIAYRGVHAKHGKRTRSEPVAALYEQKRVHHVTMVQTKPGVWEKAPAGERGLADLEDQQCQFTLRGLDEGSPDRVDAMVYAITELMLGPRTEEDFFF